MILFVFCLKLVIGQVHLEKTSLLQTDDSDFEIFSGTMTVSADTYTVECDCTDEGIIEVEEVKCQPTKIKLTEDMSGTGSTYEEISEKLESYENYTYARVTHSSFRCLDGRVAEGLLGTPGGDAGEFVLGLLVYQDLSGVVLTQENVTDILNSYLKCMEMSRFYMCTDQAAIDHVVKELALDDLDIFSPDLEVQGDLLEALIEPNNVGDTHLRMLLEYPEMYSISNELIKFYITAFYSILWDSDNPLNEILYLDILQGSHEETAFLEVKVNDQCILEQVAPLVAPKDSEEDTISMFINHVDAVGIRRGQVARFFSEKIENAGELVTTQKMHSRLNHHGLLFLDVTGGFVSKDLPFFTATFV